LTGFEGWEREWREMSAVQRLSFPGDP